MATTHRVRVGRLRGRLLAVQEVAWYVGHLLACAVGHGLAVYTSADGNLILGFSTLPTLIALALRLCGSRRVG